MKDTDTKTYIKLSYEQLARLLNLEEDISIFGLCLDNGKLGIFLEGGSKLLPKYEDKSVVNGRLKYSRDCYGNDYLQEIEEIVL